MPLLRPHPDATPRERLRRMARGMQILVACGAVALMLLPPIAAWSDPHRALQQWQGVGRDLGPIAPPLPLPWVVLIAALPGLLLGLFALWQLWRLFASYGQGAVFGAEPTRRLRRLGWAMLASALLQPLVLTLTVLALTLGNPPGQRKLVMGFGSQSYLLLLMGGLLLAIAWAMAEGTRLQQENESFV